MTLPRPASRPPATAVRSITECRRRFFEWMGDRYDPIGPDPLNSDAFPTSFVPSAGPNLAARALLAGGLPERWNRVCVIQPCIRYWDIGNVGDRRHLSFFEMATFVSLREDDRGRVLEDLYDLMANGLGLDPETFWVTVYAEGPVAGQEFPPDEQALALWRSLGILEERLVRVSGIEGFVANRQEAVGGYRTEIYCERTSTCRGSCPECLPGKSDCGRFIEVATSVTYANAVDFSASPVIRPVAGPPVHAAGFGLERALQVALGSDDISRVDSVARVRDAVARACPSSSFSPEGERWTTAVADHLKVLAFLAADGASELHGKVNKGRRWIVNRYARSLRSAADGLGLGPGWMEEVLPVLAELYGDSYPCLRALPSGHEAWLRGHFR